MSGVAVAARGVGRVYRGRRGAGERVAVDGVDLTIEKGEWVALLGPNGAGKSTLLRIISTADRADVGSVEVCGESGARGIRGKIGVVFQSASVDRLLTVRENLLLQCALVGLKRKDAAERVGRMAERFGFADRMGDRVGVLSGGLVRRVDLARALLGEPEVLLLDEATAGLDPAARERFFEQLEREREERGGRGVTVLMSTHHVDEAERCGRVVMMHAGRVVLDATMDELHARYGGARTIETDERGSGMLEARGITVQWLGGRGVARGGAEEINGAARELIDAGVAVRVGGVGLGEVYMEATGERLGDEEEAA